MKYITIEQYDKLRKAERLLADVQLELCLEDDKAKPHMVPFTERWRGLFSLRLQLANEMHSFQIKGKD